MAEPFKIIEHPADIGFIAYGSSLEELFANAALALVWLTCELPTIEEKLAVDITVTGENTEILLYAWLAEVLAVADAHHLVFRRATVREISDGKLTGTVYGESVDRTKHQTKTYIKAVTMHQLNLQHTRSGWQVQVYLDV